MLSLGLGLDLKTKFVGLSLGLGLGLGLKTKFFGLSLGLGLGLELCGLVNITDRMDRQTESHWQSWRITELTGLILIDCVELTVC